jgi:ABC-2 type transport system ATP-binding protein
MIVIEQLSKRYKQTRVLTDIDLTIAPGECFGLLGTNGAGRTTLLNILATLVQATSGHVTVAGFDVQRQPFQVRQRIGYVAEMHYFYDTLTVGEYLDFIAEVRRIPPPGRATAIDAILAYAHLEKALEIRTLSRGCRQQLAFAVAFIHKPQVLLLDEPMTAFDPLARRRFRTALQELRQQNSSILLASNTPTDLIGVCDRIGLLHHGRLVQIVERPADPATLETLLGEVQ